jgi:hydrogenase nickel incorporation protein HypB
MCATCGCSSTSEPTLTLLRSNKQLLRQPPRRPPAVEHPPAPAGEVVALEAEILAKNAAIAAQNRDFFAARRILALNLMSSPGSGKTTLLERAIRDLRGRAEISVIEGDQATARDAERIRASGAHVVQINTGAGCHLEAGMIERALNKLAPPSDSLVVIENVGNLVCPALFDLGERRRVVLLSVTEGRDKPLKYPPMFRAADVLVITKIDLLPYVDFDVAECLVQVRAMNPSIRSFCLSATRGDGLAPFYDWLQTR